MSDQCVLDVLGKVRLFPAHVNPSSFFGLVSQPLLLMEAPPTPPTAGHRHSWLCSSPCTGLFPGDIPSVLGRDFSVSFVLVPPPVTTGKLIH